MANHSGDEETTLLQHPHEHSLSQSEDSEDDEALSLCDLPISNTINSLSSSRWGTHDDNNYNKEDDDDDGDFFEFFSEEFTSSTTTAAAAAASAENIIFCGKLIPFNKDPPPKGIDCSNPQSSNCVQRSNSVHNKPRPPISKAVIASGGGGGGFNKGGKGNFTPTPIGKVSLVRSTTKSRWYLFMFGLASSSSSSATMELRDIKSRQSRSRRGPQSAATMIAKEEEAKRKECKGVWRVLRSISVGFGCRSTKLANDVVMAAFV